MGNTDGNGSNTYKTGSGAVESTGGTQNKAYGLGIGEGVQL